MNNIKNADNEIYNIYCRNLLSLDDVFELLDDTRNDGIIEKQFDIECICDNLIELMNDNAEIIANELITLYENVKNEKN